MTGLFLIPPLFQPLLTNASSQLQFGAGPHSCIGRNIATAQISKVVTEFYRRFDAELARPEKEWKVHGSWVTKQTEMDMLVTRRLKEK